MPPCIPEAANFAGNVVDGTAGLIFERAAPGMAATAATGGSLGATSKVIRILSNAATAFTQGAGSAYNEIYRNGIEQGLTHEQAHQAATGAAAASGAFSAALGQAFPGGAASLGTPAAREAAKKSFGTVMKSFLKGAADEVPQELMDSAFSTFATELGKGRSIEQAAASSLEQLPESALSAGILGGATHAGGHLRDGGHPGAEGGAAPGAPAVVLKTPENTTQTDGEKPKAGDDKPAPKPTLPPPSTPPKSVEDSQKLIDNVSKMPPEAQQHPQVQADLEQAKKVVAGGETKNEAQAQPGASDSGDAGTPPESQTPIPENTNKGTEGRPAADDSQLPRQPGSEAKDAPPVPAATDSGSTSQTAASDSNSAQTPPVPSTEQPPSAADKKGEAQATPPVQPTTPPKSVEDSRKLMENVSKMPPEARQHPQVQADLEQARQVLQDHVQKLETQKEPLSEAQKKELADAKAALAQQAPGRAASIPDTGKETPPADATPAARRQQPEPAVWPEDAARPAEATPEGTQRPQPAEASQTDAPDGKKRPQGEAGNADADPNGTPHADTNAEAVRNHGDPQEKTRSADTSPTASTARPSTPPQSVQQSQRLLENVSRLPAQAQQHPTTRADADQARQVAAAADMAANSEGKAQKKSGEIYAGRSWGGTETPSSTARFQLSGKPPPVGHSVSSQGGAGQGTPPQQQTSNGNPADERAAVERRQNENDYIRAHMERRNEPISKYVTIDKKDSHGLAMEKAALLADIAHDNDLMTPLVMGRVVSNSDAHGEHFSAKNGLPARANVSPDTPTPILTSLHEIGHHVDDHLTLKQMMPVIQAASATSNMDLIKHLLPQKDIDYYTSPSELWARAYAQYVALRSGDPEALAELQSVLSDPEFAWKQWKKSEWLSIEDAIVNTLNRSDSK